MPIFTVREARVGALCAVGLVFGAACRSVEGPGADAAVEEPRCQLVEQDYGPIGQTAVRAVPVVSGLQVPWGIAFLPDGDLLVTERPGQLRRVHQGQLIPTPVATVPVSSQSESGLLGIALHPSFATNRLFFVYFTADQGGARVNRIERWKLSDDGASASRDGLVFDGIEGAPFHDGGRLRVGPDQHLYASTGDAGESEHSPSPDSPNGKLLRLTLEGEIPADNPVAGKAAFLLGLRNPQGFDWLDASTLAVVDHGPSGEFQRIAHDEINVARAGENLGWPTLDACQAQAGLVSPRLTFSRATPPGGASFYRGSAIPGWKDSLLVGTLGSKHLHRVVFSASPPHNVEQHEVYFAGDPPQGLGRIRDVVMGPDGAPYVTTSNCDGRGTCPPEQDQVFRIEPVAP